MQTENLENFENRRYIESFFNNPQEAAKQIDEALKSGSLAPDFVEKHLVPLMREAENVNKTNRELKLQEQGTKIEQLKSALLSQLNLIDPSNHDAIKEALKNFCEERDLDILPKHGDTIYVKPDLKPDWISADEEIAVIVRPTSVWVYTKLNNNWYPTSLKQF